MIGERAAELIAATRRDGPAVLKTVTTGISGMAANAA
jgi:hypothetical protein